MELEFTEAPLDVRPDADPAAPALPLVAIGLFRSEDDVSGVVARLDALVGGAFARARHAGDFRGRGDDAVLLYRHTEAGPERVLFLGMGARPDDDGEALEAVRHLAGRAVRRAESLSLERLHLVVPELPETGVGATGSLQAGAEGLALAGWDFRELRTPGEGEDAPKPLVTRASLSLDGSLDAAAAARSVRVGAALAAGENLARTLQSRPGNVATPEHLADTARELAREHGFRVTVLGPDEMRAEGMGAILGVAAGSEQEPRLIVLEHRGGEEGAAPLALVGKGLTFDSGGISIKPASGMEDMKYDMSGGAAVLGAFRAIGRLGLPVNVVGVVPASENLLSGRATKPGDVLRTRAGKTVEVVNTDAEGRLILADALSYTVDTLAPSAIVDCATLTGAVVVALGKHAAAVLGTDEALVGELRAAGDRAGERCWPLPLWAPYRKQLESRVADLKNVGGREAGTITAAWFLREFVGEVPWAHLDIAGTAYGDAKVPYRRDGGFGFPTRLLLEWVIARTR